MHRYTVPLAAVGLVFIFTPFVYGRSKVIVPSTPITPPPMASFDPGPSFSLHADPLLSGTASYITAPLALTIISSPGGIVVFNNPSVAVINNHWNTRVFPPISTGTYDVRLSSGTTTLATSTLTIGLRSLPQIEPVASLPPSDVADGRLMRFLIRGGRSGPVGIAQISFNIATNSADVSSVGLYGFSDSAYTLPLFSSPISSSTPLNSALVTASSSMFTIVPDSIIEIPAGITYYFELDGSVTPSDMAYSVDTTLLSDQYSPLQNEQGQASTSNFVWTPNTFGMSSTSDQDWLNGKPLSVPARGFFQGRSGVPVSFVPTCTMSSTTVTINPGNPAIVSWTSTNATYSMWSDNVPDVTAGTRRFTSLPASRTFVLTFYGQGGGTSSCSINVEVPGTKQIVIPSPVIVDSLSAPVLSGNPPFTATLTASVNNAKSCAALTYSLGYGDGATSTISIAKNTCKAQTNVLTHTYTKTGTFIAGLYQSTGTTSSQLIQKQTITVKTKTSFLFDMGNNFASVVEAIPNNIFTMLGRFFLALTKKN